MFVANALSHDEEPPRMADNNLPRKIFRLSTQVLDVVSTSDDNDDDYFKHSSSHWLPFVDNASMRCPNEAGATAFYGPNTETCRDQSMQKLIWRILFWIKRIVLKLTRSYHADTAVLLILPLVMGLFIGFWMGKWTEKRSNHNHYHHQQQERQSSPLPKSLLFRWCPSSLLLFLLKHLSGFAPPGCDILGKNGIDSSKQSHNSENSDGTATTTTTPSETRETRQETDRVSLLHLLEAVDENHHVAEDEAFSYWKEFPKTEEDLRSKEASVRHDLHSDRDTQRESGIPDQELPRHVAFIMDGNRRYGRKTYGNTVAGHWDGSRKVLDVAKWCIAENIPYVTLYAFSTENWKRDPTEIASLMEIFAKYSENLRVESLERNIRVCILSTDTSLIPPHVAAGIRRLQEDTESCTGLCMNVCLSYGSRSEMVQVCRGIVSDCLEHNRDPSSIQEKDLTERLLTRRCPDPDILIRTSGEMRISNYLLWQLAYAELFFLEKNWPELEKEDFLEVIRSFASGRKRRFGK